MMRGMDIPSPNERDVKPEGGVGPLVGIIIVVTVLVAGGIYFLVMEELERRATPPVTNEGDARLE